MARIRFGVLCIPFQVIDVVGPLDLLSSTSAGFLGAMQQVSGFPAEIAQRGNNIEFIYIGESLEAVAGTASIKIQPTTTCADCPRLDYLLIGGPWPDFFMNVPPTFTDFVRSRVDELKGIFTTCTGAIVAAMMGILDGKNATTNHQFIPMAVKLRPDVKWTTKQQWITDGKFWTAGGACAGMDMFAHWVSEHYGRDVAEAGWAALDYEPRDVDGKLIPLKAGLKEWRKARPALP